MRLKGYIDESYGTQIFTLSCLMSDGKGWIDFQFAWNNLLKSKNSFLRKHGRQQLTRYHAADCSSCKGEFQGWTTEEQVEFSKGILNVFKGKFSYVVAYNIPLKEFSEEFPEGDVIANCYNLLLKFIMTEITAFINRGAEIYGPDGIKKIDIVLFHDRSRFNSILLESFNSLMGDSTFSGREYFSTIQPMNSADCVPLQAADLLAYENYKEAERTITGRSRRKTLSLLLELDSFGGRAKTFTHQNIKDLRALFVSKLPHEEPDHTG